MQQEELNEAVNRQLQMVTQALEAGRLDLQLLEHFIKADQQQVMLLRISPEQQAALMTAAFGILRGAMKLSRPEGVAWTKGFLYGFQIGHDLAAMFGRIDKE